MKLFEATIYEQNGSQEYSYEIFFAADDLDEAKELTREYAKKFYDDEFAMEGEPNKWYGSVGFPDWELGEVREIDVVWKNIESKEGHHYLRITSWEIVTAQERWPELAEEHHYEEPVA